MGRPREFDENIALDRAVNRFWERGFEATSVRDLAAEMGISCTSLYNAFGDKRAVFLAALERYLDRSMRPRIARYERAPNPKAAIRGFIDEIIRRSLERERRGCFLVNSALEIAPHDAEIGAMVAQRLGELEGFFRRCVSAGQRDGSIAPGRDAADLARLLLGVVLGIRVLARSKPDRALLEGVARPAFALLD